jgi:Family of unknown function (DUF6502)
MFQEVGDMSQTEGKRAEANGAGGALTAAVSAILRALAKVLLRHGVSYHAFADLAKRAYIQTAGDEFGIPGRKVSGSRISVLTGLTRKEVQKLNESDIAPDSEALERYNRAARVVSGWIRDPEFIDQAGNPLELAMDGPKSSFAELVRRHSGDVPPRAILDELLHVGTVEKMQDGRVKLVGRAYIPRASDSDKLAILGADVADLIKTIDHNLTNIDLPRFQRKLMYDNLPKEAVGKFRDLSAARAQGLMEYLDSWLSQHDRDVNPASEGTGRMRAGLGIFYFEEDLGSGNEQEKSGSVEHKKGSAP